MSESSAGPPEELPPYVIEGARSGRSRCKTCRRTISKGTLRIGILVEGPYGTGYMWHHLNCAARRHTQRLVEAYEQEAWNNAKEPPTKLPKLDELTKLKDESEERRKKRKPIPHVELAPSGRSSCKQCGELIEKGAPRVVLGKAVEFGGQTRIGPLNVHPRCVAEAMQAEDCATEVEGFAEALRANSEDLADDVLQAALGEMGDV